MEHEMRLDALPFAMIASGEKTIELRLWDEKRRRIAVGDTLRFTRTDRPEQTLRAVVRELCVFPSFDELYRALPLTECGYTAETAPAASPRDMRAYYSAEEEARWGVVGIRLEAARARQTTPPDAVQPTDKKEAPAMSGQTLRLTLGELLSDPRIAKIADQAIRKWDLSQEEMWHKTLEQLRAEHFGGNLELGFDRLFAASAEEGWHVPLYTEEECAADENRRGTSLVFFRSQDPEAARRPYILLVPGGGFVNVWNLTEGWPVAAQFNRLGCHAVILTYQVAAPDRGLERAMGDFARALQLIRSRGDAWGLRWDRYIPCGFSAGGYLVCLWNVPEKGFAAFDLPKPQAVFPVYPVTSLKQMALDEPDGGFEPAEAEALYGCGVEEAMNSPFEIPEHAQDFPPCALFAAARDELVNPEHSRRLARALEEHGIPCRLEIGPEGGHGFGDGTGMCMEGWPARALQWYESLSR